MPTNPARRPGPDECHPFYAPYIARVPANDPLEALSKDVGAWGHLLAGVPPELEEHRYAPDKWSIREVVGHVTDAERMFCSRALAFSRGDRGPYPGFDENEYAQRSEANARSLADLASELYSVRAATLALVHGFTDGMWDRSGVASGREFTVRSLAWIMAGHSQHHRDLVEERYLG